jgi:hypothetical protein
LEPSAFGAVGGGFYQLSDATVLYSFSSNSSNSKATKFQYKCECTPRLKPKNANQTETLTQQIDLYYTLQFDLKLIITQPHEQ